MGPVLIAAAVGAIAFERCLGIAVLDTANIDWIFRWGIDPSVNFMGWHMFRNEAWAMPPGILHSYGHPVGSSIGITDSLPVVAFPLKLVSGWLPATFQFLGLWYLACFVLLAAFGCLLVATITPSASLQVLGASLIVLSPALVHRMGHVSLSSHWQIVAALWLHMSGRRTDAPRSYLAAWVVLLWIAAGTTPYIAAMIVALSVPTIVGRFREAALAGTATGFTFLAVTGLGWWASGYFILGEADIRNSGFGLLSTNLLAPFDAPPGSLLARALPVEIRGSDQLDGYCYLGLGVFWLIAASLIAARPRLPVAWTLVDLSFALVLTVMTVFAISSTVTVGPRVLFEYDPAWWGPLTTLRASGRFIWPLYYTFVFGLVTVAARRLPARAALAILGIAVVAQAADLAGPMRSVRVAHAASMPDPLPSPFWGRVLPRYRHLVLNPTNMCGAYGTGFDYRYFSLKAGQAGVTINAGYAARHDTAALAAYCAQQADDTAKGRIADDTMYVASDQVAPLLRAASTPVTCARVDGVAVCAATSTLDRWDPGIDLLQRTVPPVDELDRFRGRLEAEYRDRMRRPAQTYRGTVEQRTAAQARYLDLRRNGCSDEEAFERLANPATLAEAPRLCARHALDVLPLPAGDGAVAMRERLESEWARRAVATSATFVDSVGEAIWLHAYVDLRLQRRTPDQATDDVMATIRRLAP